MIGILVVNKEKGVTSNSVVTKVKKILNEKKVGHAGTLDPLASGVLPILIGKATRLFDFLLDKKKTYIAEFKFGMQTDTLDLEGKVVKTSKNIPDINLIQETINKFFLGKIMQLPPIFSSKKINGKKAYDLARQGEDVKLTPSEKYIYRFKCIKQISQDTYEFEIECSSGTYIRSLARDLGEKTNSACTMTNLVRTKSGDFSLGGALKSQDLTLDSIKKNILPVESCLSSLPKLNILNKEYKDLRDGKRVLQNNIDGNYLIFCEEGCVGIGEIKNKQLKMLIYLA